jgi:hypothetical protein
LQWDYCIVDYVAPGAYATKFYGIHVHVLTKTKLRGFSPQANYTDQATAACRRS